MDSSNSTPWISNYKPKAQAFFRLFCFPYAGGGASIFRNWGEILPDFVEVCPIQLPGRETRIRERPFEQMTALVSALSLALQPYLDKPFAFWGHSMGALIGFELARQLRRERKQGPFHLFVSGRKSPQLSDSATPVHLLPEKEFIRELRKLKGTPEAVLQHAELMQLMLPILRADFTLVETYTYLADEPLECAISAFGGLQDDNVNHTQLEAWHEQTQCGFSLRMFPGDHFYIYENHLWLLLAIEQELGQLGVYYSRRGSHPPHR